MMEKLAIIFLVQFLCGINGHATSFTFIPSAQEFEDIFSPLWKQLEEHKNPEMFGLSAEVNFPAIKAFLLERYQVQYTSSPCQCGKRNDDNERTTKIVQGEEAQPHEFPWQAVILFQNRLACGGTLISNKWILTAEHCFRNPLTQSKLPHSLFQVILGNHNITFVEKEEIRMNISRIVRHPNYSVLNNNPQFDFSLIEMHQVIQFTREISPACLPRDDSDPFVGVDAIASGFGQLIFRGKTPKVLNYAKVKVLDNARCGKNKNIRDHHLCATGVDQFGDVSDTCRGDSGGPLVTHVNDKWTVIGVTSYGNKCGQANFPGVYARTSSVLQWIFRHTQLDSCALERDSSSWSAWTSCSGPCDSDNGVRIRKRICRNLQICNDNNAYEASTCSTEECPVRTGLSTVNGCNPTNPNVTDACLECMCHVASKCNIDKGCFDGVSFQLQLVLATIFDSV